MPLCVYLSVALSLYPSISLYLCRCRCCCLCLRLCLCRISALLCYLSLFHPRCSGKLGVNVWSESATELRLLLSHVDALDENAILSKIGRLHLSLIEAEAEAERDPVSSTGPWRAAFYAHNSTVVFALLGGRVQVRVWVAALQPVVRVASSGAPHQVQILPNPRYPARTHPHSLIAHRAFGRSAQRHCRALARRDGRLLEPHRREYLPPPLLAPLRSRLWLLTLSLSAQATRRTAAGAGTSRCTPTRCASLLIRPGLPGFTERFPSGLACLLRIP